MKKSIPFDGTASKFWRVKKGLISFLLEQIKTTSQFYTLNERASKLFKAPKFDSKKSIYLDHTVSKRWQQETLYSKMKRILSS
jgi:hypothetical protein